MHYYTPILQIKEGELKALGELTNLEKTKIIPLIQLLPDSAEERKGNYVNDRMKPLISGWSFLDNRLFVDPFIIGDSGLGTTKLFFEKLKSGFINVIPVVRPESGNDYKMFLKAYLLNGICIRITGNNVSADIINNTIQYYKEFFGLNDNEIDLLIDFGLVTEDNETHFLNSFDLVYSKLPKLASLRKVIVASGSFPAELGKYEDKSVNEIKRIEWSLWNRLRSVAGDKVKLIYSDYGNVNPVYNADNSKHRGTCSIKYTGDASFFIFKGKQAQYSELGGGQYIEKSKDLINRPYYDGNTFSWGDQYIMDCAEGKETSGNSTTWVKVTQNHHFVKILSLLGQ